MTVSLVTVSVDGKYSKPGRTVEWFSDPGLKTPAVLYSDLAGTVAADNKHAAGSGGELQAIVVPGTYWCRLGTGAVIPVTALPKAPAAPTLTSATAGSTSAVLVFAAPADNGGSPLTGMNIYRGTASGAETTLVHTATPTDTTFTDTGRSATVPLFYVMKAVNQLGEGPKSTERTCTPTA